MKAIVLDMYGVVVKQTGDDFVPYVQNLLPNLTRKEIETPWLAAGRGEQSSLELWGRLGFTDDFEKLEKEYLDTIQLNDGFYDFIQAARKKYKLALISNDTSRWSRYIREKFNINQYFDVISISGDLKIAKPDERIFNLTLDKLGYKPSECVYVDDRRKYLAGAMKVGMHPILFNSRNEQYDGDVVYNFKELTELLSLFSQS